MVTSSFFNKIQVDNNTYQEYNIIALKNRPANPSNVIDWDAGILKTDTHNDKVRTETKNRFSAKFKEYPDLASITVALDSGESDIAVIKTAHTELIQQNYNSFYQKIEILATFSIQVETINSIVPADTTKQFVVYISGIDTYGAISTVARSDVNILAFVNQLLTKYY